MKVLLLGDINSIHTKKWAISLAASGIDVGIFSLGEPKSDWYADVKGVSNCNASGFGKSIFKRSIISKVNYLKLLPTLKKAIKNFQPDIVHAHYASSYGLLGQLSGFHPMFISVWGNDVYEFPKQGKVQKLILKSNLKNADKIFSTSLAMKKETEKYTSKEISVIPFGVDLDKFKRQSVESEFSPTDVVIGTIKTLEMDYAIDVLIHAFAIVCDRNPQMPLKLLICGEGSLQSVLIDLCKELGIADNTLFKGFIDHEEVPRYLNMIDVFGCLSDNESFGVAVVEAMACERPVVVSSVGGLSEVVKNGTSGSVVPPQRPELAADAIEIFAQNPLVREKIGHNARTRVVKFYDWNKCVDQMRNYYTSANINSN